MFVFLRKYIIETCAIIAISALLLAIVVPSLFEERVRAAVTQTQNDLQSRVPAPAGFEPTALPGTLEVTHNMWDDGKGTVMYLPDNTAGDNPRIATITMTNSIHDWKTKYPNRTITGMATSSFQSISAARIAGNARDIAGRETCIITGAVITYTETPPSTH